MKRFIPGRTCVGVLGAGQWARMLAMEARRMGYSLIQWEGRAEPAAESEAGWERLREPFSAEVARARFLERADVVTTLTGDFSGELLEEIARHLPMAPSPRAVDTVSRRERQRRFLSRNGFPCARYRVVDSAAGLAGAMVELPPPGGFLKPAEPGTGSAGRMAVAKRDAAAALWQAFGAERAILETRVALAGELTVLVVRDLSGGCWAYDPAETHRHREGLDLSIVPARLPSALLKEAGELAREIAMALEYVGILTVELFISQEGKLLVHEVAARPGGAGVHTLDACETSQFEQQLRMVCELPAGGVRLLCPSVTWNLAGDFWGGEGRGPDWWSILQTPGAKLHLYGQETPPGRSRGHVTFLARTREEALEHAGFCRRRLAESAGVPWQEIPAGPRW